MREGSLARSLDAYSSSTTNHSSERMTWWRRLVSGSSGRDKRKTDFLSEALDLESRGDYANALTSYRLALRERPDDLRVLQNIAIAFSKTGQPEEAIRTYRRALELAPDLAGAHYGLAFLLLKRGDTARAAMHLDHYLHSSPNDPESAEFRAHAERTLDRLKGITPADGIPRIADEWQEQSNDDGESSNGNPYPRGY